MSPIWLGTALTWTGVAVVGLTILLVSVHRAKKADAARRECTRASIIRIRAEVARRRSPHRETCDLTDHERVEFHRLTRRILSEHRHPSTQEPT